VLDRMGGYLAAHPESWEDDWLLSQAEEELGPQAIAAARSAAASHTNIRLYFDAVEATRRHRQQQPKTPNYRHFTYPELRDRVIHRADGGLQRGWLMGWGRHAADDALRDAAADLLREADPRRLAAYLWIFSWRPYPLDPSRLIDLARHPEDSVACAARRALRHVTHPAVRQLALDLLTGDDDSAAGVRMLTNNFQAGDERFIEHALNGEQDEDRLEDLAHAAIEVFTESANGDSLHSMVRVYEACRCSLARAGAVEVLMKRRIAPAWMLEECRHDSYEGTRERVEAYRGESAREEF